MAVGFFDPLTSKIPITVAGMSCTLLVLIARNVHMAFDATPGTRVEPLQICHRAEPERRRGIAQPEHVRGHVHDHGTHRRMIAGHIGKEESHHGPQGAGERANQPGAFREPHDAQKISPRCQRGAARYPSPPCGRRPAHL